MIVTMLTTCMVTTRQGLRSQPAGTIATDKKTEHRGSIINRYG